MPLFLFGMVPPTGLTTTGATTAAAVGVPTGATGATGAMGAMGAMGVVGVTGALGGCELATDMGIMPPPLLLLRARP